MGKACKLIGGAEIIDKVLELGPDWKTNWGKCPALGWQAFEWTTRRGRLRPRVLRPLQGG